MSNTGRFGAGLRIARTATLRSTSTQSRGDVVSLGDADPTIHTRRPAYLPSVTRDMSILVESSSRIVCATGLKYTPSMRGRNSFPPAAARARWPPRATHVEPAEYRTPFPADRSPMSMRSWVELPFCRRLSYHVETVSVPLGRRCVVFCVNVSDVYHFP